MFTSSREQLLLSRHALNKIHSFRYSRFGGSVSTSANKQVQNGFLAGDDKRKCGQRNADPEPKEKFCYNKAFHLYAVANFESKF